MDNNAEIRRVALELEREHERLKAVAEEEYVAARIRSTKAYELEIRRFTDQANLARRREVERLKKMAEDMLGVERTLELEALVKKGERDE